MVARFFLTLALLLSCPAVHAEGFYRWTQYVPGGVEARAAVSSGMECPSLSIDGAPLSPMAARATPGTNYPVTICAMALPTSAKTVLMNGLPLPLPKTHPNRILLIGDTGCRLKGDLVQACNSLAQWPFRLGADIATEAQPDLVVHVGDYHYRETACPLGNYGCVGTPWGDNWEAWRADFFAPAESLLTSVPWVFVRGNHEECARGGKGWARALSAYPFDPAAGDNGCLGSEKAFLIELGGISLLNMDVSSAIEETPENIAFYGAQFALSKNTAGPVWIAMHRPAYAEDAPDNAQKRGDNKLLQAAMRGNLGNVTLALSGHHHTFEAMGFGADLPIQIVSGQGGDSLSPFAPRNVTSLTIGGAKVLQGIARPGQFGFAMLERAADDPAGIVWSLTAYDTHGARIARCAIKQRDLTCE